MLEFRVRARRTDAHGGRARCEAAEIPLDPDPQGRSDAFDPVEPLPIDLREARTIRDTAAAAIVLEGRSVRTPTVA